MPFTPLINYAGYEHVLNALPCFVHPGNGNLYGVAIEKQTGLRQNLSVYRVRPGSATRELVKRYIGGVDSAAQIAAGACVILPDGALQVWASAVPVGVPPITKTGFVGGFWDPIPNTDDPYTLGGPQEPPAGPGAGGVTLFPVPLAAAAWDARPLNGGALLDIPVVFGAPVAAAYLIRLVAQAATADIRVRAGSEQAPYMLTLNTQAANVQQHAQGWAPGPQLYLSTVGGAATIWLQVVGYSE